MPDLQFSNALRLRGATIIGQGNLHTLQPLQPNVTPTNSWQMTYENLFLRNHSYVRYSYCLLVTLCTGSRLQRVRLQQASGYIEEISAHQHH